VVYGTANELHLNLLKGSLFRQFDSIVPIPPTTLKSYRCEVISRDARY